MVAMSKLVLWEVNAIRLKKKTTKNENIPGKYHNIFKIWRAYPNIDPIYLCCQTCSFKYPWKYNSPSRCFQDSHVFVNGEGHRIFVHALNLLLACRIFYNFANYRHLHSTQSMAIKQKLRQFDKTLMLKIQLPFQAFFLTGIYNLLQWHTRDSHECHKYLWGIQDGKCFVGDSIFMLFLTFPNISKTEITDIEISPLNSITDSQPK